MNLITIRQVPFPAAILLLAAYGGLPAQTPDPSPAGPPVRERSVDRAKVLSEPGVFAAIATFKLRSAWGTLGTAGKASAARELTTLIANRPEVLVDTYLTRGLKADSDFFLRVHAYDLSAIQQFLVDFRATALGRASDAVDSLVGVTKPLNYVTRERSPKLNASLSGTTYSEAPPRYVIVIPARKNAAWWNLTPEARLQEMESHTQATLPYLVNVKRKLYHSSGLDDLDFITYFETNDLLAFNNLTISLLSVPENKYNMRLGNPTILGTIQTVSGLTGQLSK